MTISFPVREIGDYDDMHIYSDFAKEMLKFIIQDRARVEAFLTGS